MLTAAEFAANPNHRDCHSCVVVVLSHGKLGKLTGSDGKSVKINAFLEPFYSSRATGLAGKPKIFIFQACRGGRLSSEEFSVRKCDLKADTIRVTSLSWKPTFRSSSGEDYASERRQALHRVI